VDFELRRATPGDVRAIMELETATFANDAWSTESMLSELESEYTHYLFAFDPLHPYVIAGYAGLLAPDGSPDAEIQTIAVAPLARRHGLGRLLMERLITEADSRGAAQVFLEVRADNPNARELYDSLGFEQIAVRTNYYQPDNVDAQVMRLDLANVDAEPADEDES
jgi:[ribosomal protein S18]-alanine N-acetyltransferase